jgi:hypothetical protein
MDTDLFDLHAEVAPAVEHRGHQQQHKREEMQELHRHIQQAQGQFRAYDIVGIYIAQDSIQQRAKRISFELLSVLPEF